MSDESQQSLVELHKPFVYKENVFPADQDNIDRYNRLPGLNLKSQFLYITTVAGNRIRFTHKEFFKFIDALREEMEYRHVE